MSTIAAVKGTTTQSCTPSILAQVTPTAHVWTSIGSPGVVVTKDHKSAELQSGTVYQFPTGSTDTQMALLSDVAQNVDYQELAKPVGSVVRT